MIADTEKHFSRDEKSLIGAEQWESRWRRAQYPFRLDLRSPGIRAMADFLREVLPRGGERRIIEVGCGGSAWLPFFEQELGYRVSGIDYSPAGTRTARRNLEVLEIAGLIIEGDLFALPLRPRIFDVVFSNGFIEHFPNTGSALVQMCHLLKPGGLMVTIIPNLQGMPGRLQSLLNRPVLEQHVIMDASTLERHHVAVGLSTFAGPSYIGGFDLWALNWETLLAGQKPVSRRLFGKVMAATNAATNLALRLCGMPNPWWAAQMIAIVSRKGSD